MSENDSLINLGDWSKPANTLIKKISSATGMLYEPLHIKRIAKAEAKAALIRTESEIEITDLHKRAAHRWVEEEAQRQKNMEDITAKALPNLNEDAAPDAIEDDWIINFFDKCRIVSNDEMQKLWSRILAGEANTPGSFTKRTVNFLSDLDKAEADLFTKLCGFVWIIGNLTPLVFNHQAKIYNNHGITFDSLSHLESIGLLQLSPSFSFIRLDLPKRLPAFYYGKEIILKLPHNNGNELEVGGVMLTNVGRELAPICGSKPVDGFWEFVKKEWKNYLPKEETPE